MADKPTLQDDLKYKINIDKLYDDFIKLIDSIRSNVNISNPNNNNALKKITKENFNGALNSSTLTVEKELQESRCHAFYRLIGFPVVSIDNQIYNPGHDIIIEENRKITDDEKVIIANNPLFNFYKLSNDRENYTNKFFKIFSNNASTSAGVYAISLRNFRDFSSVFSKNSQAIEDKFDSANQSYKISDETLVGANSKITFQEYINGSNEIPKDYSNERLHIIKPFVVDARIDLTTPSYNRVAVPFVKDSTQLAINSIKTVRRPILEKIIIDRFDLDNQKSKVGTSIETIINSFKDIPGIKDQKIVNDISNNKLYGVSEQQKFYKTLNMIRAMIKELYDCKKGIKLAQSKYYWLPLPSTKGPEFGCSVQPVFINCYYNDNIKKFETLVDFSIVKCQYRDSLESITSLAAKANAVPDVRGKKEQTSPEMFSDTTSEGLGDTNSEELKRLNAEREQDLKKASNLLRKIEIITGEFSGLGLLDIVIIMGALYVMPANSLLGFLDPDAFERAKTYVKALTTITPPGIQVALNDLSNTVKSFYDIAQKISESFEKNNTNQ